MKQDYEPLIQKITSSYKTLGLINAGEHAVFPSFNDIQSILSCFKEVLFPGFLGASKTDIDDLEMMTRQRVTYLDQIVSNAILSCLNWENRVENPSEDAQFITHLLLIQLPQLRESLINDANAILNGDPAANSLVEIVLSYPGFQAIMVYRIAHILYHQKVPLIPRMMSEIVHSETGIDIHPGAVIGHSFCIDHGTGIVIGETATIGNYVKLYQGVTLGAFSVDKSSSLDKRHPTLKDHVTVYARSTILGGNTIIGKNCTVGGNVWLIDSMADNTTIYVSMNDKQVIKPR
jgi:serine O-acetyltransferase